MAQVKHGTLVADTVATVDLEEDWAQVEVLNVDGTAAIYFTVDGPAPTVGGEDCEVIPAVIGALKVTSKSPNNSIARLISSGTPKYSVRGEE